MFSLKKYIVSFLLVISLVGCATKSSRLLSVELSIYVENSFRAQPELAMMYTNLNEQAVLDKFTSWIQNSASSVSIDKSNLDRIYLIQFDYDDKTSKYILCVQINSKYYLKPVVNVSKFNLDKYDSTKNDYLIDIAGINGWIESDEIPQ